MRRMSVVALALISLVLIGTTIFFYSKYKKSQADYTQLQTEDESTRLRYGNAIAEIATIQDSLNAIVLGDEPVEGAAARSQAEVEVPGTVHDQVLTRIATLRGAIERTKERITELDARLKKSGIKIEGMNKMIAGLRRSVTEKEEQIAMLTTQVDTLQTQVTGLTVAVEDRQTELATIFYAMGSKKELVRSGVVESKGGVLGIGKTLRPTGHPDQSVFTPLDTDEQTVIQIPAEKVDKVQVLSAQPVSSYVLQPVGTNMVELRIVDAKEFRKIKQVVILTT
ncbi:MAG TPA: hypothetical protein VJW75_02980 [Candidatus Eisenbacteria bacterium]|nr:hypothetical protein [Candidatus Eisenbacteria bacterium]